MVIVAIAGSSSNYKPITNVYIGTADISHINVTKVIPQVGPILTILGTALTTPNNSIENIFGALRRIADTPALTPLLSLLSNAENTTSTVMALTELAPLAVSSNSTSSTQQLTQINALLQLSTNQTETIDGLSSLVSESASSNDNSSTVVFNLLGDSDNVTGSTHALIGLNNMTMSEKMHLAPVFELFQVSTNFSATFSSLSYLAFANLSTQNTDLVINALNQSSDTNATFARLERLVPDMRDPLLALEALINYSSSTNVTLSTLKYLVDNNVTSAPSARNALRSIASLVNNGNNDTLILNSVQSLAMISNSTSSTAQLTSLLDLFESSSNDTQTLSVLEDLETGLQQDPETARYVPSLFQLIQSSKDAPQTFRSLVTLTAWAQQNPETFIPILNILSSASRAEQISDEQLREMTPALMDYLHVNTRYQLSIFTLCEADSSGEIKMCSSSHAVQNLDFRNIIWSDLIASDFRPYLTALNVTADDLQLEGKLLKREHEYVPAIRATLAMSILSIVLAFFTLIVIFYLMFTKNVLSNKWWYGILFLVFWYVVFTCLSAIIVTAIIGIIKSGTHDDDYGVVFTSGSAYMGLIWTSFALSIIVLCLMTFIVFKNRNRKPVSEYNDDEIIVKGPTNDATDDTTSSNDNPNEKPVST